MRNGYIMTDPLDRDLARLAHHATPAALDDVERRIAAAIAAPDRADTGCSGGLALAGGAALLLGVAGGGVMAGRIEARERPPVMVAALDSGLETGLAPSTLLLGR